MIDDVNIVEKILYRVKVVSHIIALLVGCLYWMESTQVYKEGFRLFNNKA